MDDHICLCLPTAASLQLYAAAQAYISINQNAAQLLVACLSMSDSISRWKEGLLQRIRPFFVIGVSSSSSHSFSCFSQTAGNVCLSDPHDTVCNAVIRCTVK